MTQDDRITIVTAGGVQLSVPASEAAKLNPELALSRALEQYGEPVEHDEPRTQEQDPTSAQYIEAHGPANPRRIPWAPQRMEPNYLDHPAIPAPPVEPD